MARSYGCEFDTARISRDDFERIVECADAWYREDYCPAWDHMPGKVELAERCAADVTPAYIRDSVPEDPPGALAFHWVDPATGLPRIDVLADRILDQPGATIDDIETALQHEIGETCGDESGEEWSDCGDGTEEPQETVDRVQGASYPKAVTRKDGSTFTMRCTDFLLPSAFYNAPVPGAKYDRMGLLEHPREVLPDSKGGGYKISRKIGSGEQEVFGAEVVGDARAALAFSRGALERHGALEHALGQVDGG